MSDFIGRLKRARTLGEQKVQQLDERLAEKRSRLDPEEAGWEDVPDNQFQIVDGDTAFNPANNEYFRIAFPGMRTANTFESRPEVYERDPELFQRHRLALANIKGWHPDRVSIEHLVEEGRSAKFRIGQDLGEQIRNGQLQARRMGRAADGRTLLEVRNKQAPNEWRDFYTGQDENADYWTKFNSRKILEDLGKQDLPDQHRKGERSFGELATDLPSQALTGTMSLGLAGAQFGANALGLNNIEGVNEAFADANDAVERLKKSMTSDASQYRSRMFDKQRERAKQMAPMREQMYRQNGLTERQARVAAGLDEYKDAMTAIGKEPGAILDLAAESLPSMFAVGIGGIAGRAVAMRAASKAVLNDLKKRPFSLPKLTARAEDVGKDKFSRANRARLAETKKDIREGLYDKDGKLDIDAAKKAAHNAAMDFYKDTEAGKNIIKWVSRSTGIAGIGVTETVGNVADAYNSVMTMPVDQLMQSERFQALVIDQGLTVDEARQQMADQVASEIGTNTFLLATATAAAFGTGAFEGKLFQFKTNPFAKEVVGEVAEEGVEQAAKTSLGARLKSALSLKSAKEATKKATKATGEAVKKTPSLAKTAAKVQASAGVRVAGRSLGAGGQEFIEETAQSGGGTYITQAAMEPITGEAPRLGAAWDAAQGGAAGLVTGVSMSGISGTIKETIKKAEQARRGTPDTVGSGTIRDISGVPGGSSNNANLVIREEFAEDDYDAVGAAEAAYEELGDTTAEDAPARYQNYAVARAKGAVAESALVTQITEEQDPNKKKELVTKLQQVRAANQQADSNFQEMVQRELGDIAPRARDGNLTEDDLNTIEQVAGRGAILNELFQSTNLPEPVRAAIQAASDIYNLIRNETNPSSLYNQVKKQALVIAEKDGLEGEEANSVAEALTENLVGTGLSVFNDSDGNTVSRAGLARAWNHAQEFLRAGMPEEAKALVNERLDALAANLSLDEDTINEIRDKFNQRVDNDQQIKEAIKQGPVKPDATQAAGEQGKAAAATQTGEATPEGAQTPRAAESGPQRPEFTSTNKQEWNDYLAQVPDEELAQLNKDVRAAAGRNNGQDVSVAQQAIKEAILARNKASQATPRPGPEPEPEPEPEAEVEAEGGLTPEQEENEPILSGAEMLINDDPQSDLGQSYVEQLSEIEDQLTEDQQARLQTLREKISAAEPEPAQPAGPAAEEVEEEETGDETAEIIGREAKAAKQEVEQNLVSASVFFLDPLSSLIQRLEMDGTDVLDKYSASPATPVNDIVGQVLEDGAGMNFGTFAEMPEIAGNVQVIARSMSRDNSAIQNSANVVTKLQQLLSAFQDDVKLYYERNRNKLGTSAENRSASDWMRVTRGAEGFTSLDFADQLTQGQIGEIENTVNSVTGLADVDTTPVEGIRDPQQKAAAALAKLKKFNELCKK